MNITGEFGGLKWSNGEGHILFTAEKYIKKTEYFDADLDWSNEEKIIESNVVSCFRNFVTHSAISSTFSIVIIPIRC